MSVHADIEIDRLVEIDDNHARLAQALVICQKPRRVLEFGFGSGEATRAILDGLRYNGDDHTYTVVDNWFDFDGVPPAALRERRYDGIDFVTSSERDFLKGCSETYDFIFSDADHLNTQNWFELVYNRFLQRGGILIYHDVTNAAAFPNLLRIYEDTLRLSYHHALFNRSSRPGERCDRGLLVIFKH